MNDVNRAPLDERLLHDSLVASGGTLRRLEVRGSDGSSNHSLAAAVAAHPDDWPAPAGWIVDHQIAGRGRLDRVWTVPARAALTMSVLVAPNSAAMSWLPLLAGVAVARAVRGVTGVKIGLKWPNDVLVEVPGAVPLPGVGSRRKVAGILSQGAGAGAIVGIGLNVHQRADELPVPTATSLSAVLAPLAAPTREELAITIINTLVALVGTQEQPNRGMVAPELREAVEEELLTLGAQVEVDLTSGGVLVGTAQRLAPDGALVVVGADGNEHEVRSGDVQHLRSGVAPIE